RGRGRRRRGRLLVCHLQGWRGPRELGVHPTRARQSRWRGVAQRPGRQGHEPRTMSDEAAPPVMPGEMLAGTYRGERILGAGGMGVVVQALHEGLDQRVAIKFLHGAAITNPAVVERFSREAKAAAKIQSEHVARVIDISTLENGSPYMVMEYLEG